MSVYVCVCVCERQRCWGIESKFVEYVCIYICVCVHVCVCVRERKNVGGLGEGMWSM